MLPIFCIGTTPGGGGGEFKCPEEEGLFPNPEDCESYYTCANFIAWLVPCPDNEQFNPIADACDFEFNVHCVETPDGLECMYSKYLCHRNSVSLLSL
jgi:hypothetical protein